MDGHKRRGFIAPSSCHPRLVLEVELKGVAEAGECFVDGPSLAGDFDLDAARDVSALVE
ncbi:hypothetical protein [Microtetraspora malaysiensis]|uniref:hypothetical protein n=1 Tax=Microtetraspora malaysiensis TaxID=161358 RepID=UPI003D9475D5